MSDVKFHLWLCPHLFSDDARACVHAHAIARSYRLTPLIPLLCRMAPTTAAMLRMPQPPPNSYWGHIAAFTDRFTLQLPGRAWERDVFERGIDPDVDDPTRCHSHSEALVEWPPATALAAYAAEVDRALRAKVAKKGITRDTLAALEHGDMHHETLMYMGMEAGWRHAPVHPWAAFADGRDAGHERCAEATGMADVPGQCVRLGATAKDAAAVGFVWDNELPGPHELVVAPFHCSLAAITNREFAVFVEAGGYNCPEHWQFGEEHGSASAWGWCQRNALQHPSTWMGSPGSWGVRTLCDGPVPLAQSGDWPAMVTLYEAMAYCRWHGKGARIMTEPEYHALFTDDDAFRDAGRRGNNNWKYRGFVPVGAMDDAAAGSGAFDLVGNGWEWTSTPFGQLPGFSAHQGAF